MGVPALAQGIRHLKNVKAEVHYINDGKISKAIQSGHQGHIHPSEWTAPDCKSLNLLKTMLQSLKVLSSPKPYDLDHYSYLHFPISLKHALSSPKTYVSLYPRFFKHGIVHTFSSKNNVSEDDRWLCDCVRESLDFYETLNRTIKSETGRSFFERGYRIYWSQNVAALMQKKTTWESLGINCEWMTEKEMRLATLLNHKTKIKALKIYGDGKFFPETPQMLVNYFQSKYPKQFSCKTATVSEIFIDHETRQPLAVKEILPDQQVHIQPIKSFFGSPGHNQVFIENSSTPLWEEVSVSGVSSLWVCTIDQNELIQRLELQVMNAEAIQVGMRAIVASANLTNLHVTVWDCVVEDGKVQLLVRATQGANFNSEIADKNDLINMMINLERFYCGTWRLISVGTCTRKTGISNTPTFTPFNGSGFLHGLSGIGYSFSATPIEMLRTQSAVTISNLFRSMLH